MLCLIQSALAIPSGIASASEGSEEIRLSAESKVALRKIIGEGHWHVEKIESSNERPFVGTLYGVTNAGRSAALVFCYQQKEYVLSNKDALSVFLELNRDRLSILDQAELINRCLVREPGFVANSREEPKSADELRAWLSGREKDSRELQRFFEESPRYVIENNGSWVLTFFVIFRNGGVCSVKATGTVAPLRIENVETRSVKSDGTYSWPYLR